MTRQDGECTYCGARGKMTADHIPPQSLFAAPRPSNLWTVPCCSQCNAAASKDDEYLKMVLALKDTAGRHPDAQGTTVSVLRALGRPNADGFRRSFLSQVREVRSILPSGLYVGRRLAYDVDLTRLDRVVARLVKGLFLLVKGRRLPIECSVSSFSEDGLRDMSAQDKETLQATIVLPTLAGIHRASPNEVVRYWASFDPRDERVSAWILEFYRDVRFLVLVVPEAGVDPTLRSAPDLA